MKDCESGPSPLALHHLGEWASQEAGAHCREDVGLSRVENGR